MSRAVFGGRSRVGGHRSAWAPEQPSPAPTTRKEAALQAFQEQPLRFVRNDGQLDPRVKFYERGPGRTAFFTDDAVYLTLTQGDTRRTLKLAPLGATPRRARGGRAPDGHGCTRSWAIPPAGGRTSPATRRSSTRASIPASTSVSTAIRRPSSTTSWSNRERTLRSSASPSTGWGMPACRRKATSSWTSAGKRSARRPPYVYQEKDGRRTRVDGSFKLARRARDPPTPIPSRSAPTTAAASSSSIRSSTIPPTSAAPAATAAWP